jgi:hypothetical protein
MSPFEIAVTTANFLYGPAMQAASQVQRVNWTPSDEQQTPIQKDSTLFRRQASSLLSPSAALQAALTVVEGQRKLRLGRNQAMFRR